MQNDERYELRLPQELAIDWARAVPAGLGSKIIRAFMEKVVNKLAQERGALTALARGEWRIDTEFEA